MGVAEREYSSFEELLEVMRKEAQTFYENWNGYQDLGTHWRVGILHVDKKTWWKIRREAERIGAVAYYNAHFYFKKKERDGRGSEDSNP